MQHVMASIPVLSLHCQWANLFKALNPGHSIKAGSFQNTSAQVPTLETLIYSVQGGAWAWVFLVKLPEQV